jgi:hypothetical protein
MVGGVWRASPWVTKLGRRGRKGRGGRGGEGRGMEGRGVVVEDEDGGRGGLD